MVIFNRPFPSFFKPRYESEAKCKVFVVKISFHSYANKTNFRMKIFPLSLAFIVRFTATRKWPIEELVVKPCLENSGAAIYVGTATILCFNVHTTVEYLNRSVLFVSFSNKFQNLFWFVHGQGRKW